MVITVLPSAMLGRKMDGQSKTWQSHTPAVKRNVREMHVPLV